MSSDNPAAYATALTSLNLVKRASEALLKTVDWDATSYEAQRPAECWALDALDAALRGDVELAEKLLERYADAEWDDGEFPRAEYAGIEESEAS